MHRFPGSAGHDRNLIIGVMTRLGKKERKARDAAFFEVMEGLKPEVAVRREMVAARARAGLTQAQLAERMGTGQSAIARLEGGKSSPSLTTLRRLAEVTGSRLVVRLEPTIPNSNEVLNYGF